MVNLVLFCCTNRMTFGYWHTMNVNTPKSKGEKMTSKVYYYKCIVKFVGWAI